MGLDTFKTENPFFKLKKKTFYYTDLQFFFSVLYAVFATHLLERKCLQEVSFIMIQLLFCCLLSFLNLPPQLFICSALSLTI